MTGIEITFTCLIGCGLFITIAIKLILHVKKKKNEQHIEVESGGSASGVENFGDNSNTQSTSLNVKGNGNSIMIVQDKETSQPQNKQELESPEDYLGANILFIDDDPEYQITNILSKMGFRHVQRIDDVTSIELAEIRQAEILFVDVNDVGKEVFGEKEGFGAALAIKKKYPNKKVVLNSGYPHMYDYDLKKLDGVLPKGAAPEVFRATIEELYKKANHEK